MEALGQEHAARPWLSHPEDPGQEHAARPWLSHPEDTMEALGQEHAARPWLSHPEDPQGSTLLWKLPDCLSTFENTTTTSTFTNRPNDHMDNRKPMLELKDVPPPPHHPSSSSSSHPFPLASLPLPPPCLPAPPLPPDSYQQQQQQGGGSPKVSICTHCEHCGSTGSGEYGVSRGGVGVGNNMARSSGVLSLFMAPSSAEPLNNNNGASTFHAYPRHACHGSGGDSFDTILRSPGSYKLQLPPSSSSSSVATRKPPMSAHCYLPCCTGLLHAYPSIPCSQPCLFPVPPHPHPSAPLGAASSLPSSLPSVVPTSVHTGSCLVSSACYPCGGGGSVSSACCPCGGGGGSVDYSSASQRITAAHGDHHHSATTTAITTTTSSSSSSAHFYTSNPMHLNVERTVCLKGAHYCRECMLKPVNGLLPPETDKGWPTVPLPSHQSAPIPVPMCNGCGTSSDGMLLMPPSSLGKGGHKYGSPDSGGPENIPPVGVFWDIENCHVPSGRSAGAVVQRIRSRFFQGHREAEFICVCDISKESKPVIQELNNCQVTVAHINATAKNAADDKLRQSLRRFAETHTAPATVVLVSSDVNFASELSDLRHRHGFQVILVHGSHTSPALLQHAHRHVAFADITADLPPRVPLDAQPSFNLLYVHNLPVNCDKNFRNAVKVRLRRLSDNCGGKVLGVSQGTAVLRFGSQEAAERARRRMDNEDVFGHSISLSFSPRPKDDGDDTIVPPESDHRPVIAMPLLHQSSCPFQDTGLPVRPSPSLLPFSFLPLEKQLPSRSPRRPRRRAARLCQTPVGLLMPERPYSPRRGCSGPPGGVPQAKPHHQELGGMENKPKPGFHSLDKEQQRTTGSSSPHSNGEAGATEQLPKASLIGESMYRRRRECSSPRSATDSSAERGDFHVSTPSAFSKLNLHRSFSPLVHTQGSWSPSRSASPCLSSRSSPLLAPPRSPCRSDEPFSEGADVQVTNLDYRMSRKDLQQALHDTFSRYGKVKVVELSPHTDYQLKATVQMVSLQQAISAVSGLHRYKIGGKRMQVSLITGGSNNKSLSLLSTEIISILQDAPAHCLPLFKFTEIYEKKCSRKLVVGDLYRLPEVVALRDQGGSRLLCLLPNSHMRRQSPLGGSSQSQEGGSSSASGSPVVFEELEYHEPICRHHYPQQDFSEADFDPDSYKIPFVVMSLSALASQVHSLLQAHDGTLPLLSFPECYASKFPPLQLGDETVDGGVPLEHLITCIPSITIVTAQNGFKVIKWMHSKPPALNPEPWIQRCKSPVGNPQLIQFSREIIDLLKSRPACIMPINKFIPSYHHHFAKQCRVSDYGYSKLIELLEAVPHVLQILGMGTKRLLTLTHRAQVKRFTQDLLKLLKFQASKQVAIKDFMQAYHWCFSRDWRVIDYGICDLLDLLAEIPDTTITITHQDTDTVISVPKRERTVDEVERTKQFGKEVVDLLRHQPHCRMPFSKLIPTYHHHFGRQCKLSYYGFNKLIELFEAIPDVLMVLECGEEKVLTLTEVERIKALAAQLVKLLRSQRNSSLPVTALLSEYSKTFGYGLRLHDYDASSLPALMAKLCHVVKVVDGPEGREVQLINRKSLRALTCQLLALLMSLEERQSAVGLKVEALSQRYLAAHKTPLNPCEYGFLSLSELLKSLPYLVELYYEDTSGPDSSTPPPYGGRSASGREEWVRLTKLYQFARNVRALLHTYHYNQIFLTEFAGAYGKFTGCSLQPRAFGYASTDELLSAIPQVVWIKGHSHKRIIVLKNDMKAKACSAASDSPLLEENNNDSLSSDANSRTHSPAPGAPGDGAAELLSLSSPVDLLCGPVPSCLPSPELHPDPAPQPDDLIHFEGKTPTPSPPETSTEMDNPAAVPVDTEPGAPGESQVAPEESQVAPEESQVAPEALPTSNKATASTNSPGRKAPRSKIKLAVNFSFTTGP